MRWRLNWGFAALLFLPATLARATDTAAENFTHNSKAATTVGSNRQRAIAEFDTDGDGKLSLSERRAARTALAKKKRLAQTEESQFAGDGTSGNASSAGMNPYSIGSGYGSGTYPYSSTGLSSGSYFYYGTGVFGQMAPTQATMGAGCMTSGATSGRQ